MPLQVGRESRIRELGGAVVVVDKVHPLQPGHTCFPAGGQRTQTRRAPAVVVPGYAGVVPRRDAGVGVRVVDLTLVGDALFVAGGKIVGLVELAAVQEVAVACGPAGIRRPVVRGGSCVGVEMMGVAIWGLGARVSEEVAVWG